MNEAFAVLKKDSPFYGLFEGGRAPICPLGPELASLKGSAEISVYMLDVNRMTTVQVEQLAETVARVFHSSKDEVQGFLTQERKLPIRASQVETLEGMAVSLRQFVQGDKLKIKQEGTPWQHWRRN